MEPVRPVQPLPLLLRLFDQFWLAFHAAAPPPRSRTPMNAYQGHATIFEAILSGDPDRARAAIQDHYIGIESKLTENPPADMSPVETNTEAG
ncbi:FCD domain-containing protein [Nonomuraea sp. K274]|uniref:FCD domain-containing protein n=1 Tax=Nonomuraea cypriaca TaxID=1187855 RepID=A0A931EXM3_9ACTN|nr:FCD domain-containing protein [Nonomuraea cypriaca]MBF8185632.1 FCD domain-containing protein [Nonomuraea cypriaca]